MERLTINVIQLGLKFYRHTHNLFGGSNFDVAYHLHKITFVPIIAGIFFLASQILSSNVMGIVMGIWCVVLYVALNVMTKKRINEELERFERGEKLTITDLYATMRYQHACANSVLILTWLTIFSAFIEDAWFHILWVSTLTIGMFSCISISFALLDRGNTKDKLSERLKKRVMAPAIQGT